MAWGFIGELPISRDQYDRLNSEIPEDPEGMILHTASVHGGGMRIIDVWAAEGAARWCPDAAATRCMAVAARRASSAAVTDLLGSFIRASARRATGVAPRPWTPKPPGLPFIATTSVPR